MARQPEGRLAEKVINHLRANYPGWWEKIHGGPFQSRGVPDVIGCYRGRFVSIELKQPGENPTKIQLKNGSLIRKSGGIWTVAYSVEDVKELMAKNFKE